MFTVYTRSDHFSEMNNIEVYNISYNIKDDLISSKKDLDLAELVEVKSEMKQVRLAEKFGKQGFHYDTKELIEPITKRVNQTNETVLLITLKPQLQQLRMLLTIFHEQVMLSLAHKNFQ